MKLGTTMKGLALASLATMSLAGCAADTGIVENSSLTVAWNQPLYSFNVNTSNGNATANAVILYLTQQTFNYYDDQQQLIRNEQYGTYEMLTEDPLTVKYTINEGVTWSDGVAVDAADLLLNWVSLSGAYNVGEPEYDEETGQIIPGDDVYFDSVAIGGGIEQVTQVPEISDDGRSITLVYDQPMVDWELLFTSAGLPAHVIAKHALSIEDPQEAKDAVIAAIQEHDAAALKPIADFWNTGFDYVQMPEDDNADVVVGSGAYNVVEFTDQYITLEARGAEYTAGPQPKVETITVRYIPDALASIQALENGEVSITLPQATTDVLAAAEALDGVTISNQSGSTYEHIDLVFNNPEGPFGPAGYGGDEETAKSVRQAFLMALDVNDVIDKLIKPLNPNAVWDQSQVFLPGAPGYDGSVAGNGSEVYGQGDAAAAADLLAEAGVATPIDVCMLFSSTNTRRVNEYALYAEQVADAGFNLVDCSSPDWGSLLGSGTYDASLFGWQSTSTAVTASAPTFRSDGTSNFTGYDNSEVDSLYTTLASEFDRDTQISLMQQIDALLWEDAYGMTIFQFPEVLVYDSDLTSVSSSPLSPNFFWNYWEWEVPAAVG
jgi:peptide/nickel transport system substrate-binding protein